jgi:hypothetical protein
VARRLIGWGGVWLVGSIAAFLLLDPILASFLVIVGLCLWGVAVLSSGWEQHPSFEQRELARARDRARWEAHQRRKAERGADR